MKSLDLFDQEIADLVNGGGYRPAIDKAKNHAVHALTAAAGVYASCLADEGRAVEIMLKAVDIQPNNPVLYSNLTAIYCRLGCYDHALAYGKQGVNLPDAGADMYYNYGVACKHLGLLQHAADVFTKAVELNPDCALTHCQLSTVLLPLGRYEEGLREDEWRFKVNMGLKKFIRRYTKPYWNKELLVGKKILVFNEQGYGDAIQFARYIPKLKELGATVILAMQPELYELFINSGYELLTVDDTPPEHDFIVSVNSLPYLLDPKLDNIPMSVPYVWPTEKEAINLGDGFKVGVIWAGSQWHTNDKDRSCFQRHFKSLVLPSVRLFSLQHGNMRRTWTLDGTVLGQGSDKIEVVDLLEGSDLELTALTFKDFNETALALQKLDLLVSVDTSVAHLAGAMGLQVWLLLPYAHEWRWRKAWYPTMRVFRQSAPGDWQGLLERVGKELHLLISSTPC